MLEHLALTATTLMVGKAIGLSTFLGLVDGPVMTSYRIWLHFVMNLVATWFAGRAGLAFYRERWSGGERHRGFAMSGEGGI